MSQYIFYFATNSPALRAAGHTLKAMGYQVSSHPWEGVTHLVLPIPSFDADGGIKGGGDLGKLLQELPKAVTIIGGNMPKEGIPDYQTIDLLQDPCYLADNAAITAYCAVRLAMMEMPVILRRCPVLIVGWGRISQCLSHLLHNMGANVTVAARKESDRAMAHALGFSTVIPSLLAGDLGSYRLIFNTAPAPVLSQQQISHCHPDCLKIDLASVLGISGRHVLWARGLPGKDAPESSGALIAETILRLLSGKEEAS